MKIPFLGRPKAGWPFRRRVVRPDHRAWRYGATLLCLLGLLLPAAAQTQRAYVKPVGRFASPGSASGVQVVGNLAHLADGHTGLEIIDVTNPAGPVLVGGLDTPGTAFWVQTVGNVAYVADGESGLQIIDVTNPAAPVRRGGYDTAGRAYWVQVAGNLAYVADGNSGLQIIDVTNPAVPVRVGGYNTSGVAGQVQVVGDLAYVADGESGLQIIDVTNPAVPARRGGYNTTGSAYGVHVVGNLAYVADGGSGLQIIDVTNPAAPVLRGGYDTPGFATLVQSVGNLVYMADYDAGLQVLDVTNPAAPLLMGSYDTLGLANQVQVVGDLAYVADSEGGLQILKVTFGLSQQLTWPSVFDGERLARETPLDLTVTASSGLPVTVLVTGPAAVNGGFLTVTNSGGVTLIVEQAGDAVFLPAREVRQFNFPKALATRVGGYATTDSVNAVQVVGDLAYVADGENGLQILDVSNPAAPVRRGGFNTSGSAYEIQVVGNFAYVADGDSGLQIIDVTNPAAPVRRGVYNTPGSAFGVQVVGNLAYVADSDGGLQIIDVTNPALPVRRGGYDTAGFSDQVQVVGNLAYVADGDSGLQIIDLTDPAAPVRRGGYNTPGFSEQVQVVGNLAYVADDSSGLQIIDVTDPTAPVRLGGYETKGSSHQVQVVGNLAYLASGSSGFLIVDVSLPAAPVLVGAYETPGLAYGVQVVGNHAYVADSFNGLQILDFAIGLTQSLTLDLPQSLAYDGRPLPLGAASSAGLPLTYQVLQGPGTIVNNELVVTGLGRIRVQIRASGDVNTLPATLERIIAIGLPEVRAELAGNGVDVTWASGLTGLFLDGRESLDGEHPWRAASLPSKESNGRVRVPVESSPFQYFRLRGYLEDPEPLALTGWNRDVVLENQAGRRALTFDSSGAAWFESGLSGHTDGLPTNGIIRSLIDPAVVFQLQPYRGSNVLWLSASRRTNSLELAKPQAYSKLFVLAHSAGGGGNGAIRIHFADGTSRTPTPFFAPDWWDGTDSVAPRRPAIAGLGRSSTAASFNYEAVSPGFSLHQSDIELGPDAGKVITRLEFVKASVPEVTGIFAVSGIVVPPVP